MAAGTACRLATCGFAALLPLLALPGPAMAAALPPPPLPPQRPAEAGTLVPPARPAPDASPPAAPSPAAPSPAEEYVCLRLFGSGKAVARAVPPVGAPNGCGIAAPVELLAVVLTGGRRIALEPPVTVACPLAEALVDWVRDDVEPAFTAAGTPLAALTGTGGYACRGRNGLAGGKLSEHAKGDAVDLGGFALAGGRHLAVQDTDAALQATVRATACRRFTTVLGPGADPYHGTHAHLDLIRRRNGAALCQWGLRPATPPAPRGPR